MALQTLAPEYESVNPFDGKTLETFGTITDEQLEQKIATAQACYQIWRTKSYAERAAVVSKAADLMRANVDAFARTMTLEMGKRIDEARGEVTFSADILTYYAKNAERFLAPVKLNPKIGSAHMESSPIGIVFGVEPWNFPYYQLARVAGPHQMAGNVLMVKHAGIVPRCALAFEKLWIDAGAPAGLYTNLLITHEQSNRIVDDPRIKGVALTGSVAAGRSVAARAGQNVKPSSMELGGSDAFIVLEDADLRRRPSRSDLASAQDYVVDGARPHQEHAREDREPKPERDDRAYSRLGIGSEPPRHAVDSEERSTWFETKASDRAWNLHDA
jgi:succinate-semialdehyde dehydrogenase/glutarate-semialdehyde dehydrogenase